MFSIIILCIRAICWFLSFIILAMISRHYYIIWSGKKSGLDFTFLKDMLHRLNYGYIIVDIKFNSENDIIKIEELFKKNILVDLLDKDHYIHRDIDFSTGEDIIIVKTLDDIMLSELNLNTNLNEINSPFLIHFDFDNKKIKLLISHYFYDGKGVFNYIINYLDDRIKPIKFIPIPRYIPVYCELLQLRYMCRMLYENKTKNNITLNFLNSPNQPIPLIYYQESLDKVKKIKQFITITQ